MGLIRRDQHGRYLCGHGHSHSFEVLARDCDAKMDRVAAANARRERRAKMSEDAKAASALEGQEAKKDG